MKDYIRLLASVKLALQQRFTKREEHLAALTDVEVKKIAYNKVSNQTNKTEKASTKQVIISFYFSFFLLFFLFYLSMLPLFSFLCLFCIYFILLSYHSILTFCHIVILLLFHIAFVFYFLILFDIPVYSGTISLFMLILTPILIRDLLK